MHFEIKNIPEKTRYIKSLSWNKISVSSAEITAETSKDFITDIAWKMIKTCLVEDGIGLAAPQIGIFKKMIICRNFEDNWVWKFEPSYSLYINPKFEPDVAQGKTTEIEFCLSVPNKGYKIERWRSIIATWQEYVSNDKLIEKTEKIDGYPARLYQHEFDHTISISIPQRWALQNEKSHKKKLKRKKSRK